MSGSVSMVDGHIDPDKNEMTPQEALDLLNNVEFAEQYQGKDEYGTMLLMCKDALEKQIPKKPHKEEFELCETCPVCGWLLECLPNYCEKCGQALDWSDAE